MHTPQIIIPEKEYKELLNKIDPYKVERKLKMLSQVMGALYIVAMKNPEYKKQFNEYIQHNFPDIKKIEGKVTQSTGERMVTRLYIDDKDIAEV